MSLEISLGQGHTFSVSDLSVLLPQNRKQLCHLLKPSRYGSGTQGRKRRKDVNGELYSEFKT